jgi:hypothetical protein
MIEEQPRRSSSVKSEMSVVLEQGVVSLELLIIRREENLTYRRHSAVPCLELLAGLPEGRNSFDSQHDRPRLRRY